MSVAVFRAPSLQAQLAELKRERVMRDKVYPHLIATRKLTEHQAAHQNRGLDGAVKTLERLVIAELRGEPGRKELIDALRTSRRRMVELGASVDWLDALLEKVPE